MKTPTLPTPAAQATPTPWTIRDNQITMETPSDAPSVIWIRQIATISAYGPKAQNAANAALIIDSVNSHAGLVARVAELEQALAHIEVYTQPKNYDHRDEPSAAIVCQSVSACARAALNRTT